jgi:hypothetical protein
MKAMLLICVIVCASGADDRCGSRTEIDFIKDCFITLKTANVDIQYTTPEPVAAIFVSQIEDKKGLHLIVDLGHGTLDLVILSQDVHETSRNVVVCKVGGSLLVGKT